MGLIKNKQKETNKEISLVCVLDIGTSSIRASGFDLSGELLAELFVQMHYQMEVSLDGKVEIELEELFTKVVDCLDKFLAKILTKNYLIIGVGISTIWHSLVAIDAQGFGLTPLISWNDTRSSPFAKRLKETNSEIEIHQITGCRFHASYWPAKISWLINTKPSLAKKVKYWLSFGDYLFFRLFGKIATSISLASGTGLFNRSINDWDEQFAKNLSIEINQLPKIIESPFYSLKKEFATRWPKLNNIPWYLPVGDGACNNIGSACFDSSSFALMIGTSGAMRAISNQTNIVLPPGLWSYKIDRNRNIIGGAMSNAGNLFAWLKTLLNLPIETLDQTLEEEIRQVKPDSHGLTILPFLSGERSLGWHDEAKGAIIGLQLSSKPIEILRAALEAIAYQFLLIYQEMVKTLGTPKKVIATGAGLYNSQIWGEIIADVLGKELYVSQYSEASSRGIALLVLEKLNILELTPQNNFEKVYLPNPENQITYQKAFKRYQLCYEKLIASDIG